MHDLAMEMNGQLDLIIEYASENGYMFNLSAKAFTSDFDELDQASLATGANVQI